LGGFLKGSILEGKRRMEIEELKKGGKNDW